MANVRLTLGRHYNQKQAKSIILLGWRSARSKNSNWIHHRKVLRNVLHCSNNPVTLGNFLHLTRVPLCQSGESREQPTELKPRAETCGGSSWKIFPQTQVHAKLYFLLKTIGHGSSDHTVAQKVSQNEMPEASAVCKHTASAHDMMNLCDRMSQLHRPLKFLQVLTFSTWESFC